MERSFTTSVTSPSGQLRLDLLLGASDQYSFDLWYGDEMILRNSRLGLQFSPAPQVPLKLIRTEVYDHPTGGREMRLKLLALNSNHAIVVAYRVLLQDDMLAFRYEVELQEYEEELVLEREDTTFRLAKDGIILPTHTSDEALTDGDRNDLVLPLLVELDGGLYLSVERTFSPYYPPSVLIESGECELSVGFGSHGDKLRHYHKGYVTSPWWVLQVREA